MDSGKPPAEQKKPENTLSAVFDVGPHVKEDKHWSPFFWGGFIPRPRMDVWNHR